MSQILTRAHDELYKRTPDERFSTMQDLWDSCQARKQRSELLWHSADDLRAIPRYTSSSGVIRDGGDNVEADDEFGCAHGDSLGLELS